MQKSFEELNLIFSTSVGNLRQEIYLLKSSKFSGAAGHLSSRERDISKREISNLIDERLNNFLSREADLNKIAHKVALNLELNNIATSEGLQDLIDVSIKEKLVNLQDEVNKLKAKTDDVILFHKLGFRNPKEANSWVEEHCPTGRFGLAIDFHTMMEHIFQKIKGIDELTRLKKVHKFKWDPTTKQSQLLHLKSWFPDFFSKSGDHKVYEEKDSYFFKYQVT